jgi:hypothetical protein
VSPDSRLGFANTWSACAAAFFPQVAMRSREIYVDDGKCTQLRLMTYRPVTNALWEKLDDSSNVPTNHLFGDCPYNRAFGLQSTSANLRSEGVS